MGEEENQTLIRIKQLYERNERRSYNQKYKEYRGVGFVGYKVHTYSMSTLINLDNRLLDLLAQFPYLKALNLNPSNYNISCYSSSSDFPSSFTSPTISSSTTSTSTSSHHSNNHLSQLTLGSSPPTPSPVPSPMVPFSEDEEEENEEKRMFNPFSLLSSQLLVFSMRCNGNTIFPTEITALTSLKSLELNAGEL